MPEPNYDDIEGGWIGTRQPTQQPQQAPVYGQQGAGTGGMMGAEYYKQGVQGGTWANDADARYQAEHSIDPNTGEVLGPWGAVPAGSAMQFQAAHNQAVWRAQQRRATSAANYMQGALGLLQSYRPGGGAALESGIYQNLAQVELSRAQLMQPLDLLGDYRRDEAARARQKANRQAELGMAIQGVGVLASLAAGPAGAALFGVSSAAGAAMGQPGQGGTQTSGDSRSAALGGLARPGESMVGGGMTPIGGGQGGASPGYGGAPPLTSSGPSSPGGPAQARMGGQGGQAGPGGASPGPGGSGVPGNAGGGDGAGAGVGAGAASGAFGPLSVGIDGDFSPNAYARTGAAQVADPIQPVFLSMAMANMIENDDFLPNFSSMVEARLKQRGVA